MKSVAITERRAMLLLLDNIYKMENARKHEKAERLPVKHIKLTAMAESSLRGAIRPGAVSPTSLRRRPGSKIFQDDRRCSRA